MIRTLALLALLGASTSAAAIDVAIGNLAPGTLEREPVAVFVDGDQVSRNLAYRRFVRLDLPEGSHRIAFVAPGDSAAPLVERQFTVTARNGTTPTVVLAGNGTTQPYSIEFHDGSSQPATAAARPSISLHHLAPFERAEATDRHLVAGTVCRNNAGHGSTQTRDIVYRGEAVFDPGDLPRLLCTASFVLPGVGGFELPQLSLPPNGVMRVYLIGDAVNAPFEIIAVVGTEVQSISGAGATNPSAIIRSPTFWFDPDRPSEGVSLFEQTGNSAAFGTWFTFGADGHPVWYALVGGTGTSFLRREFTVYEARRAGEVQSLAIVGSAVLQYFDCNTAELRVVLGGSDLRTLRLRRSRPVEVCIALDRNG
ncbi:MAG TPA: DUF4397 domain-containing protein [Candidatus Saccharimonadia bacterium]|nr:DUF4397 domain-containing protein [Candidatus Saccharimonadia bacterium]